MEKVANLLSEFITAESVALLSVVITVLIFIFSRYAELKYKKHDDKKVQYLKLIELMEKTFSNTKKNKKGEVILSDEMKKLFFDAGASLLMYGSKKIYKLYLLFREYTSNPLVKQCKYYTEDITIHIISEIFMTMRKEVGLSYFNNIAGNEALAFFVNDISSNPIAKEKAIDAKFRIRMIKMELWIIDRTRFLWLKAIYSKTLRPGLALVSLGIKYFFLIPLGRLISVLFPNFAEKINKQIEEDEVKKKSN